MLRRGSVRTLALPLASALLALAVRSGETPSTSAPIAYYSFAKLIDKAERILLGEIGETRDGVTTISVLETLKEPATPEPKLSENDFKEAEKLLAVEADRVKNGSPAGQPLDPPSATKQTPKKAAKSPDKVEVETAPGILLPHKGVQVVFFLWDRADKAGAVQAAPDVPAKPVAAETAVPRYRLAHPQAIYEPSVTNRIKTALFNPRSIADGRYLRDWDRKAAEKLAQRKADEELVKLPPGEAVQGMKLEVLLAHVLMQGDNSFQCTTHLVNIFSKEQTVYDGPAPCYGVILRAKDKPVDEAYVLHINNFESTDVATLNITNMTDFESLDPNKILPHEQMLDAARHKILKTLSGPYMLRAFYVNSRDGKKDGVNPAWTGTLVSSEIPIEFKKVSDAVGEKVKEGTKIK